MKITVCVCRFEISCCYFGEAVFETSNLCVCTWVYTRIFVLSSELNVASFLVCVCITIPYTFPIYTRSFNLTAVNCFIMFLQVSVVPINIVN
jgi:hypothetical protein